MQIYDWNEIKATADCVEYCKSELHMTEAGHSKGWTRFNCPWRPGADSESFSVRKQGYRDHVEKKSGSILDLAANAQFGGDIWRAQEHLGRYYGLSPRIKASEARRIAKVYDYTDLDGTLRHQTVRFEPKGFAQRRPDPTKPDHWIWNLDDIDPVLYRMDVWRDSSSVAVVGGEKDADNLIALGVPATTNAMGEGNWRDEYNQRFAGKSVVIVPDNDDAGTAHAQNVAQHILPVAMRVKILTLPDLPPKGDVSDWIDAGGTKAQFLALARDAQIVTPQPEQINTDDADTSVAKRANLVPLSNYTTQTEETSTGKVKEFSSPRQIVDIMDDVFRRFWGFPRRVGRNLFDHDRKTGQIRFIEAAQALSGWIAEKSGHPLLWKDRLEGAVSKQELYYGIFSNAQQYQLISGVPSWPSRTDVYYTHNNLPAPTADARMFYEFCDFFAPHKPEDRSLIELFVAAPLYYRYKVDRPLWIIDSPRGQGVGKTKLVEMVAYLYGGDDADCGEPIWVNSKEVNNEIQMDRVIRRLLTKSGRKKRIMCLDNVTGYFNSPSLSTLATQGSVTGLAPFGRTEETRPNDLTYVITSNSATVGRDIASRAFILQLDQPDTTKEWELQVVSFIRAHRLQIIADIVGILERGPQFDLPPVTRFRTWEREVMVPVLQTPEIYTSVFKLNQARKMSADGELDEAEQIREYFTTQIREFGYDPDDRCFWIRSNVVTQWAGDAVPGIGGRLNRNAMHKVRNMIKGGMLPELSSDIEKWPTRRGHRGLMWNHDKYRAGDDVIVFSKNANNAIETH